MTKYTDDLKLSVIHHYLNGHGYQQTAKDFGMDCKQVELWVKLYQAHGFHGIRTRTSKTVYSSEFKHHAVLQILAGKSIRQLAIELNISNPALLSSWLKAYQNHGTWDYIQNPKAENLQNPPPLDHPFHSPMDSNSNLKWPVILMNAGHLIFFIELFAK